MAGFCLWPGAQNRAYAETSVLKAPAAEKTLSQYGLILLKNSSLIGRLFSDSIALLIGRIGDDGTEAGSTGGAVL